MPEESNTEDRVPRGATNMRRAVAASFGAGGLALVVLVAVLPSGMDPWRWWAGVGSVGTLLVASHAALAFTLQRLVRARQGARARERERVVFEAQRLESIGRLAGGVAHDVNNVLSAITTFGSVLKEDVREGRAAEDDVDTILKACASAHDLTRNLLGFARQGDLHREPVAVGTLLEPMAALLTRTLPKSIAVETRIAPTLAPIEVDKNQIRQALLNLAVNAVDAMPEGGTLTLGARESQLADGREAVELLVGDTGQGMTPEVRARIFEPFFTTKPEGKGTGLGLPMVYGTVRSLGGTVTLDSAPGRGTTVRLTLPACADRQAVSSRPVARPSLGRISGTVLVVDDEPIVRRGAGRALKHLGFDPVEVASGYEAIETLRANREPIEIALVDLSMPGLSGADTIERLLEIKPDLRIIVATGHFHDAASSAGHLLRAHGFLQKPFDLAQLEAALHETRNSMVHPTVRAPLACSG